MEPDKSNKIVQFAQFVVRYRWLVILACVLVAAFLASGARFLEFSNNYRVFFGKTNPQLIAFEEVENSYTKNDNVMFVLAPQSGQVFSRDSIAAVQWLTEKAWHVPYSTRVDSLTNFQHTTAQGDDLYVDDLIAKPAADLTNEDLAKIEAIALNEVILHNRLVTDKKNVTGVNVSVQVPGKKLDEVIEVTAFARGLVKEFQQKFPTITVYLSGMVIMNNAFAENGQKDAQTLTPLMYLIMIIVMTFLLRSFPATLTSLGVIILSTSSAMGIAGSLGIKLTPPSSIAATVILTLAIADSVHVLSTMLILMRKGWQKTEALVESLRINMQAVFLTSLTTFIGFLCLNFSDSPPYHDLGNITAIGVVFAFCFSVTFLPAFISILPVKVSQRQAASLEWLGSFSRFVYTRRLPITLVSLVFLGFMISFIPKLNLNDQFVDWFDKRLDFRRASDFMTENLTGIYQFDYSVSSGQQDGVSDPAFMKKIEAFTHWWRERPEVLNVVSYTDIMKKINKTLHADDPTFYKLPDNEELAAQYLLLYEMSLPFGLDLNNQIDIDKSSVKVSVILEKLTSVEARALASLGDNWLKEQTPSVMHATATGPSVMFSYISERNVSSMIKGTILAMFLITLLLIASLKSIKYGLLSLVPNVIPIVISFGAWSMLFKVAGMEISIVASATLGIIVDDTVHFITKYLRARREDGLDVEASLHFAFTHVGLPIIITSIILAIGFAVLIYSPFRLNWALGAMSTLTILIALIIDFLLLPSILGLLDGNKKGAAS